MNSLMTVVAAAAIVAAVAAQSPIAQTRYGAVRGFHFDLPGINRAPTDVKTANIFLGVPFASPPTGKLRFEKPQEPSNWTEPLETVEFPPSCVPHHPIAAFTYDEDCLYLNVFAPTKQSTQPTGYPVLVYIHGGGFCTGSTAQYGYENVTDNFVSQGIVVVTIQYRLGMLGFLSNGDDQLPGNIGLWDQRQALLWIRDNIRAFGGDPNKVTLWGQSAGAASVSMHSLSKHSRGLFHKMILHSGSPYAQWATNEKVVDMSQKLATTLNCPTDDSTAMKNCMKDMELEEIMDAAAEFPLVRDELAFLNYNPRLDGDFFDTDHEERIREIDPLPVLAGFNTHEAIFLTIEFPNTVMAFRGGLTIDPEEMVNYNREKLIKFIEEHGTQMLDAGGLTPVALKALRDQVERFYADPHNRTADYRYFLEQYTLLASDLGFIAPLVSEAMDRARRGAPVYLFQFDHVNSDLKQQLPFRAVSHGSEYPYLFGVHMFGQFEMNARDRMAQRQIVGAFVNFVKNGDPTTRQMKWKPIRPDEEPIRIGVLKSVPHAQIHSAPMRRVRFWQSLSKQLEYNVVRGTKLYHANAAGNDNELKRKARVARMRLAAGNA